MNKIINDKKGSRFVIIIDGLEVYELYAEDKGTIDLYSTYTPPQLRGKGLAADVVKAALEYAEEKNLKVIPTCWYVRKYVDEHPEYKKLILDKF
ncbi:MAG: N-acetyltransferase [Ignavibacterium sp.]|nr:N-acetyltransferase [Ignavibacterium sp.]